MYQPGNPPQLPRDEDDATEGKKYRSTLSRWTYDFSRWVVSQLGLSFVTVNAETTTLPNSLQLTAGSNITLTSSASARTITVASTGGGGGAPVGASYVTLGLDGTLTSERVLTAGSGVSFVDTGANGTLTVTSSAASGGFQYGTGSDGALHFDGAATILGIVPAANVYTFGAAQGNINATSIIVDAGVTLKTQNWNVFCQGDSQINGVINCAGNNSAGGTSGTPGASIPGGFWIATVAGAAGALALPASTSTPTALSAGDTGVSGTGLTGTRPGLTSTCTAPTATQGGVASAYQLQNALIGAIRQGQTGSWNAFQAGCGGASGGGGGGTAASGGGGSAGILLWASKTFSGSGGSFNLKGGDSTQTTSVNCGGSNGGSGGILFIITTTLNYASFITRTVAGGTHSNATAGAGNTNGSDGGAGRIIEFFLAP